MTVRERIEKALFKQEKTKNQWKEIYEVYYYITGKYVLIYPDGKETKISPVNEVSALGSWRVNTFWEEKKGKKKPYLRFSFQEGRVDYYPTRQEVIVNETY